MKVNDKVELQVLQTQALIDQKADSTKEHTDRQSLRVQTPMFKQKQTGSVLVTENSQLVSVFIVAERNLLYTLDSDYMLKSWSLSDGHLEQTLLVKKDKPLDSKSLSKNLTINPS